MLPPFLMPAMQAVSAGTAVFVQGTVTSVEDQPQDGAAEADPWESINVVWDAGAVQPGRTKARSHKWQEGQGGGRQTSGHNVTVWTFD